MESGVSQRIRMYIKNNRYTVRSLAELLNMNEGTLAAKLNGSRSMDIDTICGILDAFPGLSAEWLLRGEQSKTSFNNVHGDNIQGEQISVHKDDARIMELLQQQINEEKARSDKYWETIQRLIDK